LPNLPANIHANIHASVPTSRVVPAFRILLVLLYPQRQVIAQVQHGHVRIRGLDAPHPGGLERHADTQAKVGIGQFRDLLWGRII